MRFRLRDELANITMLVAVCGLAAWNGLWTLDQVSPSRPGDSLLHRPEALLVIPLVATVTYLSFLALPRIDPLRANYQQFWPIYSTLRTIAVATAVSLMLYTHAWRRGVAIRQDIFVAVLAAALMLVVGNLLPKVQPNWFFGIRTPWTLSSATAWRRTHRLAGWLFVGSGAVVMLTIATRPNDSRMVTFATLALTVATSTIYSYFAWRADVQQSAKGA